MMKTFAIGSARERQQYLYSATTDALLACENALKPGNTVSDVLQDHADTSHKAGLNAHRLNACGYSQGTTYAPFCMDPLMICEGNPVELKEGMVFFLHMIIFDDDTGLAATNGRTSLATASGSESLSNAPCDLIVKK